MSLKKCLIVCAITITSSGCCSLPEPTVLPIPERLELIDWTQAEWDRLSPDLQDKVDYNSEQLKRMVVEREAVIRAHNEALQD